MRKPLIAANWKMNKTVDESVSLINRLKSSLKKIKNRDIVICPAFTSLQESSRLLKGSNIDLGAQNMHYEDEGAFTGEISPSMLKNLDCEYVILGHSERRQLFNEDDALINNKIKSALKHNLRPILCIGETLSQRKNNKTFNIIKDQLENCLKNISNNDILKITIAYEPIWAIGTGMNATPKQAEEIHVFIRNLLPKNIAQKIRILYGGSVKPDNAKDLMKEKDIDGALVGGASLKAEDFTKIVKA
jgi:triosephosphate isomerase